MLRLSRELGADARVVHALNDENDSVAQLEAEDDASAIPLSALDLFEQPSTTSSIVSPTRTSCEGHRMSSKRKARRKKLTCGLFESGMSQGRGRLSASCNLPLRELRQVQPAAAEAAGLQFGHGAASAKEILSHTIAKVPVASVGQAAWVQKLHARDQAAVENSAPEAGTKAALPLENVSVSRSSPELSDSSAETTDFAGIIQPFSSSREHVLRSGAEYMRRSGGGYSEAGERGRAVDGGILSVRLRARERRRAALTDAQAECSADVKAVRAQERARMREQQRDAAELERVIEAQIEAEKQCQSEQYQRHQDDSQQPQIHISGKHHANEDKGHRKDEDEREHNDIDNHEHHNKNSKHSLAQDHEQTQQCGQDYEQRSIMDAPDLAMRRSAREDAGNSSRWAANSSLAMATVARNVDRAAAVRIWIDRSTFSWRHSLLGRLFRAWASVCWTLLPGTANTVKSHCNGTPALRRFRLRQARARAAIEAHSRADLCWRDRRNNSEGSVNSWAERELYASGALAALFRGRDAARRSALRRRCFAAWGRLAAESRARRASAAQRLLGDELQRERKRAQKLEADLKDARNALVALGGDCDTRELALHERADAAEAKAREQERRANDAEARAEEALRSARIARQASEEAARALAGWRNLLVDVGTATIGRARVEMTPLSVLAPTTTRANDVIEKEMAIDSTEDSEAAAPWHAADVTRLFSIDELQGMQAAKKCSCLSVANEDLDGRFNTQARAADASDESGDRKSRPRTCACIFDASLDRVSSMVSAMSHESAAAPPGQQRNRLAEKKRRSQWRRRRPELLIRWVNALLRRAPGWPAEWLVPYDVTESDNDVDNEQLCSADVGSDNGVDGSESTSDSENEHVSATDCTPPPWVLRLQNCAIYEKLLERLLEEEDLSNMPENGSDSDQCVPDMPRRRHRRLRQRDTSSVGPSTKHLDALHDRTRAERVLQMARAFSQANSVCFSRDGAATLLSAEPGGGGGALGFTPGALLSTDEDVHFGFLAALFSVSPNAGLGWTDIVAAGGGNIYANGPLCTWRLWRQLGPLERQIHDAARSGYCAEISMQQLGENNHRAQDVGTKGKSADACDVIQHSNGAGDESAQHVLLVRRAADAAQVLRRTLPRTLALCNSAVRRARTASDLLGRARAAALGAAAASFGSRDMNQLCCRRRWRNRASEAETLRAALKNSFAEALLCDKLPSSSRNWDGTVGQSHRLADLRLGHEEEQAICNVLAEGHTPLLLFRLLRTYAELGADTLQAGSQHKMGLAQSGIAETSLWMSTSQIRLLISDSGLMDNHLVPSWRVERILDRVLGRGCGASVISWGDNLAAAGAGSCGGAWFGSDARRIFSTDLSEIIVRLAIAKLNFCFEVDAQGHITPASPDVSALRPPPPPSTRLSLLLSHRILPLAACAAAQGRAAAAATIAGGAVAAAAAQKNRRRHEQRLAARRCALAGLPIPNEIYGRRDSSGAGVESEQEAVAARIAAETALVALCTPEMNEIFAQGDIAIGLARLFRDAGAVPAPVSASDAERVDQLFHAPAQMSCKLAGSRCQNQADTRSASWAMEHVRDPLAIPELKPDLPAQATATWALLPLGAVRRMLEERDIVHSAGAAVVSPPRARSISHSTLDVVLHIIAATQANSGVSNIAARNIDGLTSRQFEQLVVALGILCGRSLANTCNLPSSRREPRANSSTEVSRALAPPAHIAVLQFIQERLLHTLTVVDSEE